MTTSATASNMSTTSGAIFTVDMSRAKSDQDIRDAFSVKEKNGSTNLPVCKTITYSIASCETGRHENGFEDAPPCALLVGRPTICGPTTSYGAT